MHPLLRRPCAAAALALTGLLVVAPVAHAQNSSFSAVATPTDFRALLPGQWYVHSQTISSATASNSAEDSEALSTLPGGPGSAAAVPGLLSTSAQIQEAGGPATAESRSDFQGIGLQVDNRQDITLVGPSLAVSFATTLYTYYANTSGPITFTTTLRGQLNAAQAGDAFGLAFVADSLEASTQGLEAVADTVGIDLDLEALALVQNIRDAAATLDVRTGSVTLRKDSARPGGVSVSDDGFSVVSAGRYVDCGDQITLPICGRYQHAIGIGMVVAATNGASAQYGLTVSAVQTPVTAVPEPGSVALALAGLACVLGLRRQPTRCAG